MVEQGADVIDVGGESTRPGAEPVSEEMEMERVLPVIQDLRARTGVPISIDTRKARVAEAAVNAGADMINDTSAMRDDPKMVSVIRETGVPVVLMHRKGTPQTMQLSPHYSDVVKEVRAFLLGRMRAAEKGGIPRAKLVVDPGIGFGKDLSHNLKLLKGLQRLTSLGVPVMVGPSRKAFLGAILGGTVKDRLEGTLAAVAFAALHGANFVRVHDVMEVKRIVQVLEAILSVE
jgi:dihydropteroate synthase